MPSRPDAGSGSPLPRDRIVRGFRELLDRGLLHGADLSPEVLKKTGQGKGFLPTPPPPMRRLLSDWSFLFGNRIAPEEAFRQLAFSHPEFAQRNAFLLFGKDRVIYETEIAHGPETIGELILFFRSIRDPREPVLGWILGRRMRIVYIEQIRLTETSSGYASSLFRYYEDLFRRLGFHQFRLKASLSVGKYYWAKEGFDCLDGNDLSRMREQLSEFVASRDLPVTGLEIRRLNHAYDIARFRRDLKVPVFRDERGYYSLRRDDSHVEEVSFPLGKAFLLASEPWDGYKVICTDTPRRTAFIGSPAYLRHETRAGHAESARRLAKLSRAAHRDALHRSLVFLDPYPPDPSFLERIHGAEYLKRFQESVRRGDRTFMTVDCSVSRETFEVASLAVGGVLAGIDAVLNRRVENAFCAVRPPGHHAGRSSAMGFCFLNNVAAGAIYAREVYGVSRIFILDWDVHHGNGTEQIFEEDPDTFFCSIHEHPSFCYPGTGRRMDRGKGAGLGATRNIPLMPHAGDPEAIEAFEQEVAPEIERFRPELILVSAGFDGHRNDAIADLEWTERAYVHMTERLCELADRHCEGRIVSVLEGGYNPDTLVSCTLAHLRALQGVPAFP